ncbi:hypothetical protein D3C75_1125760 [compost metagenome]
MGRGTKSEVKVPLIPAKVGRGTKSEVKVPLISIQFPRIAERAGFGSRDMDGVAHVLNIADGRESEHAGVFPAELGRALVTDAVTCVSRVQKFCEQQTSCDLQPYSLLILERAHGGDLFEMLVQG